MKRIGCIALAVVLILSITACSRQKPTWQEQYDLGVRYLSEGNYEEAIIAFEAAIEIDPKQSVIYENLAEAYLEMGDWDKALDILREGYHETGSDSLLSLLEELESQNADSPSEPLDDYLTDTWVKAEEWTINGVPFWQASHADVAAAYPTSWSSWSSEGNVGHSTYSTETTTFFWNMDRNALWSAEYSNPFRQAADAVILEERDISTGSDFAQVMKAIGFSEDGIELLRQDLSNMEYYRALASSDFHQNDYIANFRLFREETDSSGSPGSFCVSMSYTFDKGIVMGIDFHFRADGNMDYCMIIVNPVN